MLKIIGLWPEKNKNQREELLSKIRFLLNVIILITVLTIPVLMSLIRVWGDMILMIDNLQYSLPIFITILKVFIMWYKKEALLPLINMIMNDWIKVKMEEERIVMLKQARIVRLLANPKYELTYLAQTIAIATCGLSYTAVDNFLGLLILHICGQIENLRLRLLNLGKKTNFKEVLKYNVKDHIRLNRSIEIIDNTFNIMLLGLLFLFGILFCLHGFLIINVNQGGHVSILQLVYYISTSTCILMHMCLYCAVGELLVTQSEKIHHATYEYIWYTLEPKDARNLTLIMLRTQKPLNITAGKTFPMTMSTFYLEWAISLNRCMLKIIGLWPEENKNQREELLSKIRFLLNVIMLIIVLTIPALMSLIRVWGDMILMIDNLQYTLPLLITTLKVFIMWYNKGALSPLINMIVKDWIKVKMEEERIVMLKQARIIRLLAICGALMILSTPNFELTYLIQVIGLTTSGLSYTAVDNFLGLLILHICGQMENLRLRLLNLGNDSNFNAILKYNVKDHIRLIRSIETIDNTFNLMLLGLLFFFGILVVNRGGHLSIWQLIWYISATVCVLMHTCLYCAVGELLVTQSEKIHRATYEYVWYTLEPKTARDLILIMLRTKKPLNITAGKTFPMTMSTFCNVSFMIRINNIQILW
ncbi:Odorant receptor Or2 [Cyphomyrmex costatus]|uniref:Odorant receptor Or2 n=1 Tax=Cyphomyrmex costatus TaxID=456900 RepID=A0A195CYE0_9HYME|nr:Odorant receptor Or2 [Cyphomyrmex costatus]